jgi:hypothetical protein
MALTRRPSPFQWVYRKGDQLICQTRLGVSHDMVSWLGDVAAIGMIGTGTVNDLFDSDHDLFLTQKFGE